jgi:O-acetyl-ADP-ribose deacetylase (regulator of RNase III)
MSSYQKTLKNTVIEISVGDITQVEHDVIIIPTNTRLLPSGKVRCDVLRSAGAKVQLECNWLINQIGQVPTTQAVMTSGGNLKAQKIIHVVGPKIAQKLETKKLMHATWNSLKLADEKGFTSVGIPSISKGTHGFTPKICSDIMIPTINKFILEFNQNIKKISIILEDEEDFQAFKMKLEEL